MLTLSAPSPLNGDLLRDQLSSAGLDTKVRLSEGELHLPDLDDTDRSAAQAVLDAHPAEAQAALNAATTERTNETTLRGRAEQALAANLSDIAACDTILGLPSTLTNAQRDGAIKELARQSRLQAQELNALIRLVLRRFDGTD